MKLVALLLTFTLIFSLQAKEKLRVGLYPLEPLVILDNNIPSGIVGGAFHRQIANQDQYTVEYSSYSFARFMLMLERGELDLGLLVAKNDERLKKFYFSNLHLWTSRPALVIKKESPLRTLTKLSELEGKKIGHAKGSIIPEELEGLKLKWFFRSEELYFPNALKSLTLDRLDGFFVPTMTFALHQLELMGLKDKYSVVALPITGIKLYAISPKSISREKFIFIEQVTTQMWREITQATEDSRP